MFCKRNLNNSFDIQNESFINDLVFKNTSSSDNQQIYDNLFIHLVSKFSFCKLNYYTSVFDSLLEVYDKNGIQQRIQTELKYTRAAMKEHAYKYFIMQIKRDTSESTFLDPEFITKLKYDAIFQEYWGESETTDELYVNPYLKENNVLMQDINQIYNIVNIGYIDYNIEELLSSETQEILFYRTWLKKGSIYGVHHDFGRMSFNGNLEISLNYHCNPEEKKMLLIDVFNLIRAQILL